MRILVNALSATNLSGRHVLLGHLAKLANWTVGKNEYLVLYHDGNRDICKNLGTNVNWCNYSILNNNWVSRTFWEQTRIQKVIKNNNIDLLFTPSGNAVSFLPIPQITFAQNPWCLVAEVQKNPLERLKASAQRLAYKKAMRISDVMVFNSEFMKQAYRKNAGFKEKSSIVVNQAIDDVTHKATEHYSRSSKRKKNQIVCVSVMAPHKGIETLVKAIEILTQTYRIESNLILIGAWPNKSYEHKIRKLVSDLNLTDLINFKGHVPRRELNRHYAESEVFCLMSWCESFGLPAVEAQAFGTPVVSSNCCAIPEICGAGGIYPDPGDERSVADRLAELLNNKEKWGQLSEAARDNASKYRWDICSPPLLDVFNSIQNQKQN